MYIFFMLAFSLFLVPSYLHTIEGGEGKPGPVRQQCPKTHGKVSVCWCVCIRVFDHTHTCLFRVFIHTQTRVRDLFNGPSLLYLTICYYSFLYVYVSTYLGINLFLILMTSENMCVTGFPLAGNYRFLAGKMY